MSTALAIKCDELNDDLSLIETLTVSCYRCDEDNPLCVPRKKCPECRGTGRAPVRLAGIVREIRGSKQELKKSGSATDSEYLEY